MVLSAEGEFDFDDLILSLDEREMIIDAIEIPGFPDDLEKLKDVAMPRSRKGDPPDDYFIVISLCSPVAVD